MKEKHVAAIFSTFAVIFGLATCDGFSFTSGFFAGAAAIATYFIWEEDIDDAG